MPTIAIIESPDKRKIAFRALAERASSKAMAGHPRDAWAAVRLLQLGSKSHHVHPEGLALHNPTTGKNATTPAENLAILKQYCTKLYNRNNAPVDWSIVREKPQRPYLDLLG
jgi:hypothetical protein